MAFGKIVGSESVGGWERSSANRSVRPTEVSGCAGSEACEETSGLVVAPTLATRRLPTADPPWTGSCSIRDWGKAGV